MRTTLRDIAEATGFSVNTVSRAVRDDKRLSEATRSMIKKKAEEMHYIPNAFARGMRSQSIKTIGVLSADSVNPFFRDVIAGIEERAEELGYQIMIGNSEESLEKEKKVLSMFLSHQIDGLLAIPVYSDSAEHSKLYKELSIPYILVGRYLPDLIDHSLLHEDEKAQMEVFDYLLDNGHEGILYIQGPDNISNSKDRIRGMEKSYEKHGLEVPSNLSFQASGHIEDGYAIVNHALNKGLGFTAVACFNDLIAMGVMKSLAENNLRVPEDVEVFGFDNLAMSQFFNPSLSTVDIPKHALGRRAVDLLALNINSEFPYELQEMPSRLVFRDSTCRESE